MIDAFAKAIRQLPDPALRRVAARSIAGAAGVFALLCGAGWFALAQLRLSEITLLNAAVDVLGALAVLALAVVLYPAAVSALIGLFLEDVARAVEREHYPQAPAPRAQGVAEAALGALRFALVAVTVNLLALPLYLALMFVPPLNAFVFYGVNGYLVGREYFELAASRRLPPEGVREFRRANRARVFLAGGLTAFLLTVPVVNLAAPIVGMAAMVHILERLRHARAGSTP
ncbi:MAG: EI24 domain-containing protein [Rhodospirillales bacterium]